jgi:hypothetical protein
VPLARLAILLLAATLCVAACGGGGKHTSDTTGAKDTMGALLARPGPDVALVQGTSDYAVGPVRVTFLVIDSHAKAINRPRARVWVAKSLDSPPLVATEAALEPIGIPGTSEAAVGDVAEIYVARFRLARPGTYTIVAQPEGAEIQGVANLKVAARPQAPAIGDRAVRSRTPTLASSHGDPALVTTASPPDRSLLRYSVASSLAAHAPFVLVFATPKYCQSRTCGPVVDVAKAAQKRFAGSGVRFIHVEIYRDNNPAQGYNRWFKEWRLPSEPFVFLVGRDGRIKGRFEGSVSVAELAEAVRADLL